MNENKCAGKVSWSFNECTRECCTVIYFLSINFVVSWCEADAESFSFQLGERGKNEMRFSRDFIISPFKFPPRSSCITVYFSSMLILSREKNPFELLFVKRWWEPYYNFAIRKTFVQESWTQNQVRFGKNTEKSSQQNKPAAFDVSQEQKLQQPRWSLKFYKSAATTKKASDIRTMMLLNGTR